MDQNCTSLHTNILSKYVNEYNKPSSFLLKKTVCKKPALFTTNPLFVTSWNYNIRSKDKLASLPGANKHREAQTKRPTTAIGWQFACCHAPSQWVCYLPKPCHGPSGYKSWSRIKRLITIFLKKYLSNQNITDGFLKDIFHLQNFAPPVCKIKTGKIA